MTLDHDDELSLIQMGSLTCEPYTSASQIFALGLVNLRSRLEDPLGTWKPTI
jgi:hypothetical protein